MRMARLRCAGIGSRPGVLQVLRRHRTLLSSPVCCKPHITRMQSTALDLTYITSRCGAKWSWVAECFPPPCRRRCATAALIWRKRRTCVNNTHPQALRPVSSALAVDVLPRAWCGTGTPSHTGILDDGHVHPLSNILDDAFVDGVMSLALLFYRTCRAGAAFSRGWALHITFGDPQGSSSPWAQGYQRHEARPSGLPVAAGHLEQTRVARHLRPQLRTNPAKRSAPPVAMRPASECLLVIISWLSLPTCCERAQLQRPGTETEQAREARARTVEQG